MTTYRNSFHKPESRGLYGPEFFETSAKPEEYRGHLIYRRLPEVYDIVTDGVCIGQYAGPNGARHRIDMLVDGHAVTSEHRHQYAARRAATFKVGDRYPDPCTADGWSTILAIAPYKGKYTKQFTHVFTLSTTARKSGRAELPV